MAGSLSRPSPQASAYREHVMIDWRASLAVASTAAAIAAFVAYLILRKPRLLAVAQAFAGLSAALVGLLAAKH